MPADNLSREEIERVQENLDTLGFVDLDDATMLLQATLTEPARLASARAEGVREGIERCATRLEEKAAAFLKERDRHMRAWNETEGTPAEKVHSRRACSDEATAASLSDWAAELRALPPPPAEPTGMTAEQIVSVLGDPLGGVEIKPAEPLSVAEPSAPVAPEGFEKPSPGASVAEIEAAGYRNTIMAQAARITALEAENAELRKRNAALEDGLRPFAVECNEWVEQVHLLPDETVPEIKAPSDDAVATARFTLGDLRRARGLLQGGPDGRPAPAGVAQNATTLAPWCETCQSILDAIAAAREKQVALARRLSDRSTDLRARGDADEGARVGRDAEEHRMAAVTLDVLFDRCNAIVFGGGPDAG